jgi:TPR repeat protein
MIGFHFVHDAAAACSRGGEGAFPGRMFCLNDTVSTQRPRSNVVMGAVLVVLAAGAGLMSSHLFHGPEPISQHDKMQAGMQALRAGYDQTALSMFKPLADEGNEKAQYWVADIYENGWGVPPDAKAAIGMLEKSAAQGFVPAERHLGDLYLHGNKVLQDFGRAHDLLHKAADAGDSDAQRELGQMFALGLGVAVSKPDAYAWYENAALGGDGLAKRMRDTLLTRMTPDEIAQGEQAAKRIAAEIKPATAVKVPTK